MATEIQPLRGPGVEEDRRAVGSSARSHSRTRIRRPAVLLLAGIVLPAGAFWARQQFQGPRIDHAAATVELRMASLAASQGEFGDAVQRAQRSLTHDPAIGGASRVLGYALYRQNRFDEAREALEQAVREKPDDAFAVCFLGLCYAENPRAEEEAIRAHTLLEQSIPGYRGAEPWYGLGLLALRARRNDEAIRHFQRAVQQDPGWESGRYRLAEAYRLAGQVEEARREAQLFDRLKKSRPELDRLLGRVAQAPDDGEARLQLARLCLRTRRYREALDHFRVLANRSPGREVFVGLAEAAGALGESALAERARRAAAEAGAP